MIAVLQKSFYICLIIVIGTLALLLVGVQSSFIKGTELLIVGSGSMEPTISTGSLILVRERAVYAIGDVVTFSEGRDTTLTTHRIVGENVLEGERQYTTQGDANEDPDIRPITESDIKGEVAFSVPYLGYLLDFAKQPLGFVLLIILPAALIIFEEIARIVREVKKKRATQPVTEEEIV